MSYTITLRGFSAHYGSPDARLRFALPAGWHAYIDSFRGVIALMPAGFPLPEWLPSGAGLDMSRAKWEPLRSEIRRDPRAKDIRFIGPRLVALSAPPVSPSDHWRWSDLLREQAVAELHPDNLAYYHRVYPVWIDRESEPVTGPLAPLGAAEQNAVAEILMHSS